MTKENDFIVPVIDDFETAEQVLRAKLIDAETPSFEVDFDPDEAERAGAFVEDALSEEDARESMIDLNSDGETE
jgi:hypothetical protein